MIKLTEVTSTVSKDQVLKILEKVKKKTYQSSIRSELVEFTKQKFISSKPYSYVNVKDADIIVDEIIESINTSRQDNKEMLQYLYDHFNQYA